MAKAFDGTLNVLTAGRAADRVAFVAARVGLPAGPAEAVDTDLSVTAQADRLFRVAGPPDYLLHLEFESSGRLGMPGRLLAYNVPAHGVHDLPVHSVLVLLRPAASATDLSGVWEVPGADGRPYLVFRYGVVRVWQLSAADLLASPGLAPLSMLTAEAVAAPGPAFDRLRDRLRQPDVAGNVAKDLLISTRFLLGLRFTDEQITALYGSLDMWLEDSSTYQAAVRKGEAQGLAQGVAQGLAQGRREVIAAVAARRFGPPPAEAAATLGSVTDLDRLGRMAEKVADAAGWDDLLATP